MALNLGDIIVRLGLDTGQFTRDMRAAQRAMQGAGAGMRQAGTALTASVTLPILAVGAAALKFASDFDAAMSQSVAIMAEFSSKSEMTMESQAALRGEMEQVARTVAKDLNLAAADSARSFFFLASAGLTAQQQIAALPQVAAFAKAGMFDFATATDLATDAQSALGLTVSDSQQNLANLTRVTDVLVKANTLANASVEQFSTALTTKAGAALKVANKSIEEGVAVLAAFADQGIKAQDAGTALNIVLRDLSSKALLNQAAFKTAGVAVFNAEGNYRNMADIIGDLEGALAGMSDAQKKATLLQLGFADKSVIFLQTLLGSSEAIREYQASLEEAGGTTQEVAEKQLKAFNEQLGLVQKRVIDAAITLGQALMPIVLDLADAMDPLVELLVSAAEWFGNLSPTVQLIIVGFTGLLAAAGVVLTAFGFIAQGIAGLIAAWPLLVGAVGAAATFITTTAIPVIVSAFSAMATFITATAVPAVMAFATAALPFLGMAIAAAAAGFVAFELTSWLLEITGAQPVLDSFADSLFNVQRNAEGFSMPSFLSKEDLTLIELAEDTLGRVFTRTAEGRREAVAAMHEYRTVIREGATASEAMAVATTKDFDATARFAQAVGVTSSQLETIASRLGMSSTELLLNKKAVELVGDELKKMAAEAKDAEKRLRSMVKTHKDAQKDANLLAKAIELEGGALALTNVETERIAGLVAAWKEENVEVADSLEEVARRAEEMARATEQEAAEAAEELARAEREAAEAAEELELAEQKAAEAAEELARAEREAAEAMEEMVRVDRETIEATEDASTSAIGLSEVLGTVGDVAWQLSGIFGPAFDQIVSSISGAITAGEDLADSLRAQDIGGAVGAVAAGAMALAEAVEGGGAAGIARGAITGAAMGASVGGAYGAAIGGAIGALWGWLSEDVGAGAGQALGRGISQGLESSIAQTRDMFADFGPDEEGITTAGAALLHLGNAMREFGGAAGFGIEATRDALASLIGEAARGALPLEQALGAINDAFTQMAESAIEGGTVASRELFQVMQMAEQLGEDGVAAIADFRAAMTEQAVMGVTMVVGERIEGAGRGAEPTFGGIQIVTEEDAAAQAEIFNTTFFAAVEEMGIRQAVEAMGPAFDVLREKLEGFGAADLSGVQRFFDIARDPQFGPLLDGVQGLSDALAGASNAGFLTNDMFFAIQSQGQSAFEQLTAAGLTSQEAFQQMAPLLQNIIDASIEYGIPIDENTAALIEQAEANGIAFSTDPQQVMVDTLMVIAELLGATEEQLNNIGKSTERTSEEFDEMATAGEEDITQLSAAAEGSAEDIEDSYSDMSLNVKEQFDDMSRDVESPLGIIASMSGDTALAVAGIGEAALDSARDFDEMADAARGVSTAVNTIDLNGNGNNHVDRRMQHGGVVTEPTIALIGEAGPEAVVPLTGVPGIAAAGAAAEVEPAPAGGEGVQTRVIQLVLDRRVLFEVVEDGTRQGELRIHERSFQRFGD